jgi:hypothetical protein
MTFTTIYVFGREAPECKVKKNRYYRGHPKVNVFFYSLIFTLNHRRPKMSRFDTSDKKIIETIFFKYHISLRFRQLGLLQRKLGYLIKTHHCF